MKHILILAFSLFFISSQLHAATEISPGVMYPSGSDLKVSTHGIELEVPENWQAMLPQDSDYLMMESSGSVGRMLVTLASNSDKQSVRQMLDRPLVLDAMTRIKPSAEVTEKDGLFSQSYQVVGMNLQNLAATAYGRLGDNQTAVFVIMLAPEDQKSLLELGKKLINSIVFSAPKTAAQVKAEANSNTASSDVNWDWQIRGRALEYVKKGDGATIKKRLSFCSNGRVFFTDQDSYTGNSGMSNFSANAQTTQNGHWKVSGDQLELFLSDDSHEQYRLSKRQLPDSNEWGIFLDDDRWVYKRNRACR
jgi:hypothetical protein